MKVVVGIDHSGAYVQALRLLARLRFPHLMIVMVHVAPLGTPVDEGLLQHAELIAEQLGIEANTFGEVGNPAQILSNLATFERSDLIAIGSHEKGPLKSLLFGSVGRELMVHWSGSLLVAKGVVRPSGGVRCVFAYDGDDVCDQGLQRFAFWNPSGVEHIEVVTVEPLPIGDLEQTGFGIIQPSGNYDVPETLRAVAERGTGCLKKMGFPASGQAVLGDVVYELRTVMVEARGELLVLPSVKHGSLERAVFGSTSLAEVVGEHHSVLVVR